ncbi:MAG: hypothetical protein ABI145_13750 [Steroidobacteraceae bacterium]
MPEYFGAVFGTVKAASETAYRALIAKTISFYKSDLFNPHWGEQMTFQVDNTLRLSMVFHGLTKEQAQATWTPFIEWVRSNTELSVGGELMVGSLPARMRPSTIFSGRAVNAKLDGISKVTNRHGCPNHFSTTTANRRWLMPCSPLRVNGKCLFTLIKDWQARPARRSRPPDRPPSRPKWSFVL